MMVPSVLSLLNVTNADMDNLRNQKRVVILDIGSSQIKAGFSGDTKPSCVVPTSAAISGGSVELNEMSCLMETESTPTALSSNSDTFSLDESSLEAILNFTLLKKLEVRTSNHSVLVSQSFLGYHRNKEKIAHLLFEKFLCPSCLLMRNNELSLYSSGRLTGVSMEIGASDTHCVPLKDSFPLVGFITRSDVTGNALTERLQQLLIDKGYPAFPKHVLEDLKKKTCEVSANLFTALKETEEEKYCLPDGTEIRIGKERYQCPEIIFNPIMSCGSSLSICQAICEAVEPVNIWSEKSFTDMLYNNIVVSGGTANLRNLGNRMTEEINKSKKKGGNVKVTVLEDGAFAAFRGGSIVSSHSGYEKFTFTREEYLEQGINVLYRKM